MMTKESENVTLKPAEKYVLTIEEASRYFEIGVKKMRELYGKHKYDGLFSRNSSKVLVIRPAFEEWLCNTPEI